MIKMEEKRKRDIISFLKEAENSEEAKEMRERLAGIAKKIQDAPKGANMKEVMNDLSRTRRMLSKDARLNALYGFQAKALMEEAEFKQTGKRVVID